MGIKAHDSTVKPHHVNDAPGSCKKSGPVKSIKVFKIGKAIQLAAEGKKLRKRAGIRIPGINYLVRMKIVFIYFAHLLHVIKYTNKQWTKKICLFNYC